jgi:hypothetical protein
VGERLRNEGRAGVALKRKASLTEKAANTDRSTEIFAE